MTDIQPTQHLGQERAGSALSFDAEAYRPMVADAGMTREQETKFLEALWTVMLSFVDLGFGRDPVQQAMDVSKRPGAVAGESRTVVSCGNIFNEQSKIKGARSVRRATRKKES